MQTTQRRQGLKELIGDALASFVERTPGAQATDEFLKSNLPERERLANLLAVASPAFDASHPMGLGANLARMTGSALDQRGLPGGGAANAVAGFLSPSTMLSAGVNDPVAMGLELSGAPSFVRAADDLAIVPGMEELDVVKDRPSRVQDIAGGDTGALGGILLDSAVVGGMTAGGIGGAMRAARPKVAPYNKRYVDWKAKQIERAEAVSAQFDEAVQAAEDAKLAVTRAAQTSELTEAFFNGGGVKGYLEAVQRRAARGDRAAISELERPEIKEFFAKRDRARALDAERRAIEAETPDFDPREPAGAAPLTPEEKARWWDYSGRVTSPATKTRNVPADMGMASIGDEMIPRAQAAQARAPRVQPHQIPEDSGLARQVADPEAPDVSRRMGQIDDTLDQVDTRARIAEIEEKINSPHRSQSQKMRLMQERDALREQIAPRAPEGTGIAKADPRGAEITKLQVAIQELRSKPTLSRAQRRRLLGLERQLDELGPVGARTERVSRNLDQTLSTPPRTPRANEPSRVREQRAVLEKLADDLDPTLTRAGTPARYRRTMLIDERTGRFNQGLRDLEQTDAAILQREADNLQTPKGFEQEISRTVSEMRRRPAFMRPKNIRLAAEREAAWKRTEVARRNDKSFLERIQTKAGREAEAVAMAERRIEFETQWNAVRTEKEILSITRNSDGDLLPGERDDIGAISKAEIDALMARDPVRYGPAMKAYSRSRASFIEDRADGYRKQLEEVAQAMGHTATLKKRVPLEWDTKAMGRNLRDYTDPETGKRTIELVDRDPRIRAPRQERPKLSPGDTVSQSTARRRANAALRVQDLRNAARDPDASGRAVRRREKLIDEYLAEPDIYQGPAAEPYNRRARANQAVEEYRASEAYRRDMKREERLATLQDTGKATAFGSVLTGGALAGAVALSTGKDDRAAYDQAGRLAGDDPREARDARYDRSLEAMIGDEWTRSTRRGVSPETADMGRRAMSIASREIDESQPRADDATTARMRQRLASLPQDAQDALDRLAAGELRRGPYAEPDARLIEDAIDMLFASDEAPEDEAPLEDLRASPQRAEADGGMTAQDYLEILDAEGYKAMTAALAAQGIKTHSPEDVARGRVNPWSDELNILDRELSKRGLRLPRSVQSSTAGAPSPLATEATGEAGFADLQRALVSANLYDGRIDANPGPQTRAALASLERLTGKRYDITTPEGREEARRAANRVVPREEDYRRLTADLQRALELAGYPVGKTGPDGLFGVNTLQAYNQARADAGLPPVDSLPTRNYGAIDRLYSDILNITE